MNTQQMISPLTRAWSSAPQLSTSLVGGALALLGQRRARSRRRWGFIGGAAVLAAAGVLLLTTRKGRQMGGSWINKAGSLLGGQAGKVLGEQAGAHPLKTAKVVETARQIVNPGRA